MTYNNMYKTMEDHISHLALDALAQFRAGRDYVFVNKILKGGQRLRHKMDKQEIYNNARYLSYNGRSDEDNLITAITSFLEITRDYAKIEEMEIQ